VLATIEERVRFARRRFGHYDVIDFVVVLLGYAISGERTLEGFYESVHPYTSPFMAQIAARTPPPPLDALSLSRRAQSSSGRGIAHGVSRRPVRATERPPKNRAASARCSGHSTQLRKPLFPHLHFSLLIAFYGEIGNGAFTGER
jgi:hypothetical protein